MSMAVYTVPDALRKYKTPLVKQNPLQMYLIQPTQTTITFIEGKIVCLQFYVLKVIKSSNFRSNRYKNTWFLNV